MELFTSKYQALFFKLLRATGDEVDAVAKEFAHNLEVGAHVLGLPACVCRPSHAPLRSQKGASLLGKPMCLTPGIWLDACRSWTNSSLRAAPLQAAATSWAASVHYHTPCSCPSTLRSMLHQSCCRCVAAPASCMWYASVRHAAEAVYLNRITLLAFMSVPPHAGIATSRRVGSFSAGPPWPPHA